MIVAIPTFMGKELRQPLIAYAFDVDGHYYVSNAEYKIYGDGKSHEEAMDSFIQQLEYIYNQYTKLHELIV